MHRFIVASMPAWGSNVEALSTLQPRAISNFGGWSATATNSCHERTIIENCSSMGYSSLVSPYGALRILIQGQDRDPQFRQWRPRRRALALVAYWSFLSSCRALSLEAGSDAWTKRQDVHAFLPLYRVHPNDGRLAGAFDCRNDRIELGGGEIA